MEPSKGTLIKSTKEDSDFIYIEIEGYLCIYNKRTEELLRIPIEEPGEYDVRMVGGHLVIAFKNKWRTEVVVKRLGKVMTIGKSLVSSDTKKASESSVSGKGINKRVLAFLVDNRGKEFIRRIFLSELEKRGFNPRGLGSLVRCGYVEVTPRGYRVKDFKVEKSQSLYRRSP